MKYIKTIGYEFILILIFTIIYTILYYFNITNSNINNILKIISFILVFILTGIHIGRLSSKKGYLEGLKISLISILVFFLLSLIFKNDMSISQIVYYLIIIVTTTLSSMIGINFKKKK